MSGAIRLAAPAKLNLYLHVTGKRADGYHLLDGLVAFAAVSDMLTLVPSDLLAFTADGPFAAGLGDDEGNLVVRAARAMAEAAEREPKVALHLAKNLPVASGIGGGSADAAACIRGLAGLWGLDPVGPVALDVAAGLGADVPACVVGRACFIGGIGTELAPAPALPPCWVVLVNPGVALPTPDVYRTRAGGFSAPARFDLSPADAAGLAACLAARSNDLTAAAIAIVPGIGSVLAAIEGTRGCLLSRMSGSGATCFGIYADEGAASQAASDIGGGNPNWWVASGRLLEDTGELNLA